MQQLQPMTFRPPETGDRARLEAYVAEHLACGETEIASGRGLESMEYGEWLARIEQNACAPNGDWGMTEVQLGCFADNPASEATIRALGGRFVRACDSFMAGHVSHYYQISLSED